MATAQVEKLRWLYRQGIYLELVEQADMNYPEEAFLVGWAQYKLGNYQRSVPIFEKLASVFGPKNEIGESARRGWALSSIRAYGHSVDFAKIEKVMREISPGRELDVAYMEAVLVRAEEGCTISVATVMRGMKAALNLPISTASGHIISNGAYALHQARGQKGVKPYVAILPGFIFAAIKIYSETGAPKNHLADAMFRASQICGAAGWLKLSRIEAESSVALWEELVASQGGECYQRNLEGAKKLLESY